LHTDPMGSERLMAMSPSRNTLLAWVAMWVLSVVYRCTAGTCSVRQVGGSHDPCCPDPTLTCLPPRPPGLPPPAQKAACCSSVQHQSCASSSHGACPCLGWWNLLQVLRLQLLALLGHQQALGL
jgi:hypothetical protein